MRKLIALHLVVIALFFVSAPLLFSQENQQAAALDKKVRAFLDSQAGKWHDMNVPAADGKLLYDIIIKNNYTKALEIGTSTGSCLHLDCLGAQQNPREIDNRRN